MKPPVEDGGVMQTTHRKGPPTKTPDFEVFLEPVKATGIKPPLTRAGLKKPYFQPSLLKKKVEI